MSTVLACRRCQREVLPEHVEPHAGLCDLCWAEEFRRRSGAAPPRQPRPIGRMTPAETALRVLRVALLAVVLAVTVWVGWKLLSAPPAP